MRAMAGWLMTTMTLCGATAAQAQRRATSLAPAAVARVDSIARAFVAARSLPGLAVVLIADGQIVAERDFGSTDARSGRPITPATLFQVGSVTKTFTATLVGRLAAAGRVDTAAPVGRYVTGLAPAIAAIRIADLLRHEGGLADAAGGDGDHVPRPLADVVRHWGDTLAVLPPGTVFSYSNIGYTLLGAVAEAVTGLPFDRALAREVLRPLGISSAVMGARFPKGVARAVGHRTAPNGALVAVDPPSDDTRLWPAGYLAITPRGAARLLVALLDGGRIDGVRALPAAWVARATTPQAPVPGLPAGAAYGFGVFIDSVGLWHPGLIDGSAALYVGVPATRTGVVLLTNRDGVRLEGLARDLLAVLSPPPATVPPEATPAPVPVAMPDDVASLVGTYHGRFDLTLALEGGRLMLGRFGTTAALTPLGGGRWLVAGDRGEIVVIRPAVPGRSPAYIQMGLWAFPRS